MSEVTFTIDGTVLWFVVSLVVLLFSLTWWWGRDTNNSHVMDGVFGSLGVVAAILVIAFGGTIFVMGLIALS